MCLGTERYVGETTSRVDIGAVDLSKMLAGRIGRSDPADLFLPFKSIRQMPASSFTRSICRRVAVLRNTLCRCVFTVACESPSISAIALTLPTFNTASSTRISLAVSL
jgi:hypothetical protein